MNTKKNKKGIQNYYLSFLTILFLPFLMISCSSKKKDNFLTNLLLFQLLNSGESCTSTLLQECSLSLTGKVTTFAGTGSIGSTNGKGTSASFNSPYGITSDGTNLFVMDASNYLIRKIVISTGEVTTLAGSGSQGSTNGTGTAASFKVSYGITSDSDNLYVADTFNHLVRKIVISTGEVTTLAGDGTAASADGTGTSAKIKLPTGIVRVEGNLYVTDDNGTIRKIVIATGEVTTFAGTSGVQGYLDGTGTSAKFGKAQGLATDGKNLFVSEIYDPRGDGNTIRKIVISSAVVTTVAGVSGTFGSTDGIGTAAKFKSPQSMVTDAKNLYIVDQSNQTIRKIVISTGEVSTLAGSAGISGNTDGLKTAARFNSPSGITTDGKSVYIADYGSHLIRKME